MNFKNYQTRFLLSPSNNSSGSSGGGGAKPAQKPQTYGLDAQDKYNLAHADQLAARVADYNQDKAAFEKEWELKKADEPDLHSSSSNDEKDPYAGKNEFMRERVIHNAEWKSYQNEHHVDSSAVRELNKLEVNQLEQKHGDYWTQKLSGAKLQVVEAREGQTEGGSFQIQGKELPASALFSYIDSSHMNELIDNSAKPPQNLGKGMVLSDGRVLIPAHQANVGEDRDAWFVTNPGVTVSHLKHFGLIDESHGGMRMEGLYTGPEGKDGVYIACEPPDTGFFGGIINEIAKIAPGGFAGQLIGSAIEAQNDLMNGPLRELFSNYAEGGFIDQALKHEQASIHVLANSGEHRDNAFNDLMKETAQYSAVEGAIGQVGAVLASTGVPILTAVGAVVMGVSGEFQAGHASLNGKVTDANAGWGNALQTVATAYVGGQIANMGATVGTAVNGTGTALGLTGKMATMVDVAIAQSATATVINTVRTGEIDIVKGIETGVTNAVAGAITSSLSDTLKVETSEKSWDAGINGFSNQVVKQVVQTGNVNLEQAALDGLGKYVENSEYGSQVKAYLENSDHTLAQIGTAAALYAVNPDMVTHAADQALHRTIQSQVSGVTGSNQAGAAVATATDRLLDGDAKHFGQVGAAAANGQNFATLNASANHFATAAPKNTGDGNVQNSHLAVGEQIGALPDTDLPNLSALPQIDTSDFQSDFQVVGSQNSDSADNSSGSAMPETTSGVFVSDISASYSGPSQIGTYSDSQTDNDSIVYGATVVPQEPAHAQVDHSQDQIADHVTMDQVSFNGNSMMGDDIPDDHHGRRHHHRGDDEGYG